ncbi:uncharacterized protein LOC128558404 [Mercenaria mercenaria]|uniref:uncharacterized protein LOC128558404 n=1 Tax=Mercenaria mercenaria TaxID=6596 RepID=UPI00234F72A6|nr:uncharacterized protein LOC128558404 [Mercenaria mercenaria]
MTCVLPVKPFYTNAFTKDVTVELQKKSCDNFDFGWLNAQYVKPGIINYHICSTSCLIDSGAGSSVSCRVENTNYLSATVKHEKFDVQNEEWRDTYIKTTDKETDIPLSGDNQFEICKKTQTKPEPLNSTKHGVKRKADVTEPEELYIPSKRVSPFLNTPKERKAERKNILKISVKKLKQLDDPETFLRRTVLVNNTMKNLQKELRAEHFRTKNKTYFSGYKVLNNNCMSDSYLVDDPFMSGAHEKITDDMTDTLINNVFNVDDAPNDISKESDIEVVHCVKDSGNL